MLKSTKFKQNIIYMNHAIKLLAYIYTKMYQFNFVLLNVNI